MKKPDVWSESEILKAAETSFPAFQKDLNESSNPRFAVYLFRLNAKDAIFTQESRYLALCEADTNRDLEIAEWNERRKVYDEEVGKLEAELLKEDGINLEVAAKAIAYITAFLKSLMILIRDNSKGTADC